MSCVSITALLVWKNGTGSPLERNAHESDDPQGVAATHAGTAWLATALTLFAHSRCSCDFRLLRRNQREGPGQPSGINRGRGPFSGPRLFATRVVAADGADFQRWLHYHREGTTDLGRPAHLVAYSRTDLVGQVRLFSTVRPPVAGHEPARAEYGICFWRHWPLGSLQRHVNHGDCARLHERDRSLLLVRLSA